MKIKQIISVIAMFAIFGLSAFLIYQFFKDYLIIYLVSGIIVPIIVMLMSSNYCAGNLFSLLVITGGIIGFIYLDEPYKFVSASVSAYMILFKIFRYGNEMTGSYIDKNIVMNNDLHFLNKLMNSEWYFINKDKDPYEIEITTLVNQPFYKIHIENIIQILITNNMREFSKSKYSKEILIKLHSTGIIHTLPNPVTKNDDGLISTGTQMVLNVFGNLKSINIMTTLNIGKESLIIDAAKQLIEKSTYEFGEVTEEEIYGIKMNHVIE